MKKVAILQSNYIPWRGYFDLIAAVDEFVIYDDVQYTKNDWRNRNQIKTPNGALWLTIPCSRGLDQKIIDVRATDPRWRKKHWKALEANYRKAPFFNEVSAVLAPLYQDTDDNLSSINESFLTAINRYLGIETKLTRSAAYEACGDRTERLVEICQKAGASTYISGPAARSYLDQTKFAEAEINVDWFTYAGFADYPQLWGDFTPNVSVLDAMFNCGQEVQRYLRFVS